MLDVTIIIPPLVSRKGSISSGIYFMPFTMAYVAGYLREQGHRVHVLDMFAAAPHQAKYHGPNLYLGIDAETMAKRLPASTQAVIVYEWGVASFQAIEMICQAVRSERPGMPVIVSENAHAVTSMSLKHVAHEVLDLGADYVIIGEAEERAHGILQHIEHGTQLPADGIAFAEDGKPVVRPVQHFIQDLDALPFAAWDLFPIETYWRIGYAHGPQEDRYLAILTSRGCPFGCGFCVLPSTSQRRWQARSPQSVFDEMCHLSDTLGVSEFHIEDVNPTVKKERLAELGDIIAASGRPFKWKFVSGTKIETIDEESLTRMASGGCSYISFSPESGSARVMKKIGKPFDYGHGLKMTRAIRKAGVTSQAVFLLGYPGEDEGDRRATQSYMRQLVKAGLDEVLVLIATPIPGSKIFEQYSGFSNYSELTFTPTYREDYSHLVRWQRWLYAYFLMLKAVYQPARCLGHLRDALRRRFKTKMEMTLWRFIIVQRDRLRSALSPGRRAKA